MNNLVLLIGGNIGNRLQMLENARNDMVAEIGRIIRVSSIYESEPWGFSSEVPCFLNQVIIIQTALSPMEVLEKIFRIESRNGRVRSGEGYASRTIDIDILFYNDEVINEPGLQVPHPRMQQRKFTLLPLDEVMPTFYHPLLKTTIHELYLSCEETLQVRKLNANDEVQLHSH